MSGGETIYNRILYTDTEVAMFVTYENRSNPHVTVHRSDCRQIAKHGGVHRHGQGDYRDHPSFVEVDAYARSTRLPLRYCSFCRPNA